MAFTIEINENDAPQRLDRYVRKRFPKLSLSRIYSLIRKGFVKVNGSRVKKPGTLLLMGQQLEIRGITPSGKLQRPLMPDKKAAPMPFAVLHEDSDVLVLDKPSGVSVHPGSGIRAGNSIIEILLDYLDYDEDALFRPSLIHRLDKETSGVLMVAKTGRFLRYLTAQLRLGQIGKIYYALVAGRPDRKKGVFSENILRKNQPFGGRKALTHSEGKEAHTQYELVESVGDFSMLHLHLLTGRHHQIRAHLAHHDLPILGDRRYGRHFHNNRASRLLGLKRIFLHAVKLQFTKPSGEIVRLNSDLPADLRACLRRLRQIGGI